MIYSEIKLSAFSKPQSAQLRVLSEIWVLHRSAEIQVELNYNNMVKRGLEPCVLLRHTEELNSLIITHFCKVEITRGQF